MRNDQEVKDLSEKEKNDIQVIADAYTKLPPYLRGKIDGYAEAVKEKAAEAEDQPG